MKEEIVVVESTDKENSVIAEVEVPENEVEEAVRIPVKQKENPGVWSFVKAIYDPTELSQKTGSVPWFFFPLLPAVSFLLYSLQIFFEGLEGFVFADILILPIGALCGYAIALVGCLLMLGIFKIMRMKFSFTDSVAVISACFIAPVVIQFLATVINIFTPFSTTGNIGAFGLFSFMIPLSCYTVKNGKGKILPIVWLTIIALINTVIICLMLKAVGVA